MALHRREHRSHPPRVSLPMGPEVWNLLHDGVVVGLARRGDEVELSVSAPHLAARFDGASDRFVLRLSGTEELSYRPYSDRWDEPDVEDPEAIVRAAPELVEAVIERGDLVIWGSRGRVRMRYRELSIALDDGRAITVAALEDAVRAYWEEWRAHHGLPESGHPLVSEALRGRWSAALLEPLLEAWRAERTSELADVIEELDRATREIAVPRFAAPEELTSFAAHYRRAPGAALDALVQCAFETFDVPIDYELPLEEGYAALRRWWGAITDAVATLEDAPPDPRTGRATIRMLRSPSDFWFRSDQVRHVFPDDTVPEDPRPSFADHAFALIVRHADAGTAKRLDDRAHLVSIEADCNGGQMAFELRRLATELRVRYPHDRLLADATRTALRHRSLDL